MPAGPGPEVPWLDAALARAGDQALTVARRAYKVASVRIDAPALIIPLSGAKRLESGPQRCRIEPGQFVMIHRATALQVENLPVSDGLPYRAWVVPFAWRTVELARALLNTKPAPQSAMAAPFSSGELAPLRGALGSLLDVLASAGAPDGAWTEHALIGVLLALARQGHGGFLQACDPSFSSKIRLQVAAEPARAWESAHFEALLCVSGATLRRRLAQEQTSLRELIREARLHHGLALMQTTRRPLKAIAQACGYRSAASFSRNFQARFGVEPSTVMAP